MIKFSDDSWSQNTCGFIKEQQLFLYENTFLFFLSYLNPGGGTNPGVISASCLAKQMGVLSSRYGPTI